MPMAGPGDLKIHLDRPPYVYPMFEQAMRIAAGETPEDHRAGSANSGPSSQRWRPATRTRGTGKH